VTGPDEKPGGAPMKVPGKERRTAPLPKRFYAGVSVKEASPGPGYAILLDGRPVRTPRKLPLVVPTRALAEAIAAEWEAQGERIDPSTMPLSRLAITALDGVANNMAAVAADIVKFAGSDLLSYRAEAPAPLADQQAKAWDPIQRWAEDEFGARFKTAKGVMPVPQSDETLDRVAAAVAPFSAPALTALHMMTTLTGSALLALAHARGRLSAAAAWAAAHVDEDWQISQWGVDKEAAERRARRWAEMQAASRFLALLRAG
jgi:chaperone required for assembly of F1-ATPase